MGNESGTWIMHGKKETDPGCIHDIKELTRYIERVGFVPLFKNEIGGFSIEENTMEEYWWTGDTRDPWEWRTLAAAGHKVAYGKFFCGRAGFISREWIPYFANFRRDGYDFDALWDDEKANLRQKRIMDLFETDYELFSFEIKEKAGFGKEGEKNFDGTLSALQQELYLTTGRFARKKNKKGEEYGWSVALYATPESIFGYDHVRSAYSEEPAVSYDRIAEHMKELYPGAAAKDIVRLIGKKPQ